MTDPGAESHQKTPSGIDAAAVGAWALAHGFHPSGSNAYSVVHEGMRYQILAREKELRVEKFSLFGGRAQPMARTSYDSLRFDEFGMLQNAGLTDAFAWAMWKHGSPPPPWFTPEFTHHSKAETIPRLEALRSPPAPC